MVVSQPPPPPLSTYYDFLYFLDVGRREQEVIQPNVIQSSGNDLAQVELEKSYKIMKLKVDSLTVKGNLRKNLGFWRSISAPNFILATIEKGYKLPFR